MKIAFLVPYSLLGGITYSYFKWLDPRDGSYDGNITFIERPPYKLQTPEDMEEVGKMMIERLGEAPDCVVVIDQHLKGMTLDFGYLFKLPFKRNLIAFDYLDHSTEEDGRKVTVLNCMEDPKLPVVMHKLMVGMSNALRSADNRIGDFHLNGNRRELIAFMMKHQKFIYTDDNLKKINLIYRSSRKEVYSAASNEFEGRKNEASDILLGFNKRMANGFNGYFKSAYHHAVEELQRKVFVDAKNLSSASRDFVVGNYKYNSKVVFCDEQSDIEALAFELIGFTDLLILVTHDAKRAYFYTKYDNLIPYELIDAEFSPVTSSRHRGTIELTDTIIKHISKTYG